MNDNLYILRTIWKMTGHATSIPDTIIHRYNAQVLPLLKTSRQTDPYIIDMVYTIVNQYDLQICCTYIHATSDKVRDAIPTRKERFLLFLAGSFVTFCAGGIFGAVTVLGLFRP